MWANKPPVCLLQEGCGDGRPALTVEGPALVDDEVHGAHSLLDWGRHVRAVAEHQVHILHIQALQGRLQGQSQLPVRLPAAPAMQRPGPALAPHADSRPANTGARASACRRHEQDTFANHKPKTGR